MYSIIRLFFLFATLSVTLISAQDMSMMSSSVTNAMSDMSMSISMPTASAPTTTETSMEMSMSIATDSMGMLLSDMSSSMSTSILTNSGTMSVGNLATTSMDTGMPTKTPVLTSGARAERVTGFIQASYATVVFCAVGIAVLL